MSEQWLKRVWYDTEAGPSYQRTVSETDMKDDWEYTKGRTWIPVIDTSTLKMMLSKSTRSRICVITYERAT